METFDQRSSGKQDWICTGAVFVLLMLRSCVVGVRYWPQLDDYIQYVNYASGGNFWELQQKVGLLASRPLAGLADFFVWAPLFEHMIVGVALVSAMYALGVLLMKKLMERYFRLGPVFYVVMGLLPLGVEGTYWMSASTRIVVGLLFACLAALAFGRWMDSGRWLWAAVFAVLILIPFGFYEQAAVLAMTLVLGMAILEIRNWKRGVLSLWVLPAAVIYFKITGLFALDNVYSNRSELALPVSLYYFKTFLPDILGQVKTVFIDGTCFTLAKGFVRAMRLICSGSWLLWAIVLLLCCVVFGALIYRNREEDAGNNVWLALLVGVLLAVAPVSIFLFLANPWFSFRGAVTSFAGIALIADVLVNALWRKLPFKWNGPAILAVTAAFVFCAAGAVDVSDYRDTYQNDQKIAALVLENISVEEGRVGVLGIEKSFLPNQNFFWHEHIHGCTESAWAFSGLLGSMAGGQERPNVTPLPTDPIYRKWNQAVNRPESFEALYYYDYGAHELIPVRLEKMEAAGEHDYRVIDQNGMEIGRVWEEQDGIGYFRTSLKKDVMSR